MILDLAANSARLRGLFGLGAGSANAVGKRALDQAIELLTERSATSGAKSAGRMHDLRGSRVDIVAPPLVPELDVSDLERSLAIYVGGLGFTCAARREEERFAYLIREDAASDAGGGGGAGARFSTAPLDCRSAAASTCKSKFWTWTPSTPTPRPPTSPSSFL